jgi:AcrR family transcriptional regulator
MSSEKIATPLRRSAMQRPGGRTSEVTDRIFAATVHLLEQGGISAVTFQQVAKQSGVGRATLYRRWSDPALLVSDALAETAADRVRIADTGSLRGDLLAILRQIGLFIDSPTGRAAIIAGLNARQDPAFEKHASRFWQRRRNDISPVFERAVARAELSPEADTDALFGLVAGALYARMIVMAQPVDEAWIERVLGQICAPIAAR